MPKWKFWYECVKGRGAHRVPYTGEVALEAADLGEAMRSFKFWAAGQPNNRESITMAGIANVASISEHVETIEPATEESHTENEENMIIKKRESDPSKPRKFVLPTEGEHHAVLQKIVDLGEMNDPFNEGQKAQYLRLIWKIDGGSTPFQKVKASNHPMSRLAQIYQILTGMAVLDENQDLDTKPMLGKEAYITIKQKRLDDGRIFANVTDVRPVTWQGKQMPPPAVQPQQQPVDDSDIPF